MAQESEITVSGLYVYPVKSLRGISLSEASVESRGLRFDRRWMIVDEKGLFLTQREYPQMAKIATEIRPNYLRLSSEGHGVVELPLSFEGSRTEVTAWKSVCEAALVSAEADTWLSRFLQTSCRLVAMPDSTIRPVNPVYAALTDRVGFADACPVMLLGIASLQDLNKRMGLSLPINRFRPNIVVQGTQPWVEDDWREIQVGQVNLRYLKSCGRCVMTTHDQETGDQCGKEPLQTLARFRKVGNNVMFGVYFAPDSEGTIALGDPISIKRSSVDP